MLTFKLLFEAVHRHSVHIEDLAIMRGTQGIKDALNSYKSILNALKNKESLPVSIKKDGSPSCITGFINGKFFIGTKSIFNKKPKICYSEKDIDSYYDGELADKLKTAFSCLKNVITDNEIIYQGDILYTKSFLTSKDIDGIESWCFQPNSIMYTVPKNTPLGKKIEESEIGICFHTRYISDGIDPKSITLSDFNVNKDDFKQSKEVLIINPYIKNESTIALLTPEQTSTLERIIKDIENASNGIKTPSEKLQCYILAYVNSLYKYSMIPEEKRFDGFLDYLETEMQKGILEKKTEKGKEAERQKWMSLKHDAYEEKASLASLFIIHARLTEAKLIIKSYLDKLNSSKNFFVRKDGTIEATGEEGYVIISGNANSCKIVDRGAFSKVNFNIDNNYQKGWSR